MHLARAGLPVLVGLLAASLPARAADLAAAEPLAKLPGPAGTAVAFSRDGKLILTAGGGGARVWDARTFMPLTPLLGEGKSLILARLSPDGARALTLNGSEARLWDAASGEAIWTAESTKVHLVSATFSPDGSMFVLGDSDGAARVWNARDGHTLQTLRHGGSVYFTVFSPDSAKLLCLSADEPGGAPDRAYLWDARGSAILWRKGCDDWWKDVPNRSAAVFSHDGSSVATIHFRDVCVSDARTGEPVRSFETWGRREKGCANSLAFSPNGRQLATADNSAVRLWDVKSGRLARELERRTMLNGREVCFSPDGAFVAAAGEFDGPGPIAAIWDARTGERLMEIQHEGRGHGFFPIIVFSPDGRRVAVGFASDGFTGIWEVPPPRQP